MWVDLSDVVFDDDRHADLDGGGSGDGDTGDGDTGDGDTGDGDGSGGMGSSGDGDGSGGSSSGSGGSGNGSGGGPTVVCVGGDQACGSEIGNTEKPSGRFVCTGEGETAAWFDIGTSCEFACSEGNCIGICVPGDARCLSDTTIQTCNDQGEWRDSDCAEGTACLAGATEDDPDACGGDCSPGDVQCQGDVIQTCDVMGTWQNGTDCSSSGNTCDGGICTGTCTLDETQCNVDGTLITCTGTTWEDGTVSECEFICDPDTNACGGSCKPDSQECTEAGNARTCGSDGEWGGEVECDNGCVAGQCLTCSPGSFQCEGNGQIKECGDDGEWMTPVDCEFGCSENECRDCTPGMTNCLAESSIILEVCDTNGNWTQEDCSKTDQACIEGTVDDCGGECAPGQRECQGNDVYQCSNNGAWKLAQSCEGCSAGACTGNCEAGVDKQCSNDGTTALTCPPAPNNDWEYAAENASYNEVCEFICDGGDCTGDCDPADTSLTCDKDGNVQQCQDGWLTAIQNCDLGCGGGECWECDPEQTPNQCSTDGDGNHVSQTCSEGKWKTDETCKDGEKCYSETYRCEACQPGKQGCEDTFIPVECQGDPGEYEWRQIGESCKVAPAGPDGEFGVCGVNSEGKAGCTINLCDYEAKTIWFNEEPQGFSECNAKDAPFMCNNVSGNCVSITKCVNGSYGCMDNEDYEPGWAWRCKSGTLEYAQCAECEKAPGRMPVGQAPTCDEWTTEAPREGGGICLPPLICK